VRVKARRAIRSLAVAAVFGGVAVGAGYAAPAKPMQTISLLEVDTSFAGTGGYSASGSAGPSPGQGITFAGTLYRWSKSKRGAAVGHVQAVCTVTSARGTAVCEGLISLPSGTIALLGAANPGGKATDIPVVGGTGAYAGADGYLHSVNIGGKDSTESADIIHLTS
jgi:hypothetical protein